MTYLGDFAAWVEVVSAEASGEVRDEGPEGVEQPDPVRRRAVARLGSEEVVGEELGSGTIVVKDEGETVMVVEEVGVVEAEQSDAGWPEQTAG